MNTNERYREIYLKKINGYLYVLLPRPILNTIFANNYNQNHRDHYVLSFSDLNNIGDWYETIGHLYFYKLKDHSTNGMVLEKSLCPMSSQFLTYNNISKYAKSYPRILQYAPSMLSKIFSNFYTKKLFNHICSHNRPAFKNCNPNSYVKLC